MSCPFDERENRAKKPPNLTESADSLIVSKMGIFKVARRGITVTYLGFLPVFCAPKFILNPLIECRKATKWRLLGTFASHLGHFVHFGNNRVILSSLCTQNSPDKNYQNHYSSEFLGSFRAHFSRLRNLTIVRGC